MDSVRVTPRVWKIKADGNMYVLDIDPKTVIDTGSRALMDLVVRELKKITSPDNIKQVIFTHLHYDHVGNAELFRNAEFFASKEAIEDFRKNDMDSVLNREDAEALKKITLKEFDGNADLELIKTPGHTRGSICIGFPEERVIFTGDTVLKGGYGRTDLPTSVPEKMSQSIQKVLNYDYIVLCPGHEY